MVDFYEWTPRCVNQEAAGNIGSVMEIRDSTEL
jgi:hypothetical protein